MSSEADTVGECYIVVVIEKQPVEHLSLESG